MNAETRPATHLNTLLSELGMRNRSTYLETMIARAGIREMAMLYALAGIPVVPIHRPDENGCCSCGNPACSSCGKHPVPRNGFKAATTDLDRIHEYPYWSKYNLGIVPKDWVILDLDPRNGGRLEDIPLIKAYLANTSIARTGGDGYHFIFGKPRTVEIKQSSKLLPPGIDIRVGENGYVVAPPSLHASGKHYQWLPGHSPFELQPPPLPADLMEMLVKVEEVEHPIHSGPVPIYSRERSTRQSEAGDKKTLEEIIENGLMRLAQSQPGNRNNTLNEVAYVFGIQIAIGWLPRPEAERMLTDAALAKGLGEAETLKTVNSGLNAGLQAHQQKR